MSAEKKVEICPTCGLKRLRMEDFSEAELVLFERYSAWKKLKKDL